MARGLCEPFSALCNRLSLTHMTCKQPVGLLDCRPTFASAPVLQQHHRELQAHRLLLKSSKQVSARYGRLRDLGRQRLQSFGGNVRSRVQDMALFARRPGVNK